MTPGHTRRTIAAPALAIATIAIVAFIMIVAIPRPEGAVSPDASTLGASPSATMGPTASSRGAAAGSAECATPPPVLGATFGACAAPAAGAAGSAAPSTSPPVASSPEASPVASAGWSPSPSPALGANSPAPTSARGFKVRATVVPLAFPLRSTVAYRYGDAWRAPRDGIARSYNQIRGIAPDGSYLRAHDGLDLLVKNGTPVLAPFSGTVVDPATRWKPWDPGRYGRVVVIESDESTSPGYFVVLAHLSKASVAIGDRVERGQVVGRTGQTGNAAGTKPHLHLELRAPFLIRYGYAGVIRRLDVFDAEPSVRAADPHRG
jgi:murein DD-endopeptidase MepM/ murein hydrolase activator NlpD